MPRAERGYPDLVVPGLWDALWQREIRDFERDPRLCPTLTGFNAAQTEKVRRRCVAAETKALRQIGVGTPRECWEAKQPFVFPRWLLGGNTWGADYIRDHPLVRSSVQWLAVDAGDRVSAAESPVVAW